MFRKHILPYIIWIVYFSLKSTWRINIVEPPDLTDRLRKGEGVVFAHWHGDELVFVGLIKQYEAAVMTSTSKDGEIMDRVSRLLGARTSRGSSTRGGVSALKGIIRLAKEGRNPSVAVDGPKGPYHRVKPGVFEISRLVKMPIYCGAASADRAIVFEKSWNKTFLPKPFAKISVVWKLASPEIRKDQDPKSDELAKLLEKKLDVAKEESFSLLKEQVNA